MKTSNKLLITLISLIFIITSAIFLDIRVFGTHRSENNPVTKAFNKTIGDYRYLVVEGVRYLEIRPSDGNHISYTLYNDTTGTSVGMTYRIVNDTLIIADETTTGFSNSYSLYTSSTIESILVKEAKVELSGLDYDHLSIEVINGEVENYRNASKVKNLSLSQRMSEVNLVNSEVDTLSLELVSSKARFNKKIEKITAALSVESELNVKNLSDINLKKDETSRLTIY
jgi:hypothetical protein